MIRIGITGQQGFLGGHLSNLLRLSPDQYQLIDFDRNSFQSDQLMDEFVSACDVIVHLAAMNRHESQQVIYDTNKALAVKLVDALTRTGHKPHVLFSSSTQEERDNLYGKSKQEGRELLAGWAQQNKTSFDGLIIPNVFGPFGKPFYNSVVATFCHQLTHNQEPKIDVDGTIKLVYVGDVASQIIKCIDERVHASGIRPKWFIEPTKEISVSEILKKLVSFRDLYLDQGIIPECVDLFDIQLFNTFRSFIEHAKHFPVHYKLNTDNRGSFVEIIRLQTGGQVSFSTTHPGITRGNHFHTRKIERFSVIKGEASIQLRKIGTEEVINFTLNGAEPSYVDMPVWYTHNISNIGTEDLYTVFWINEFYDPADPDTFFENV